MAARAVAAARTPGGSGEHDLVYALARAAAKSNMSFVFGEEKRRLPAEDTVTVLRGAFGSDPNFYFEVDAARAAEPVTALRAASTESAFEQVARRFGVRRSSRRIWETND